MKKCEFKFLLLIPVCVFAFGCSPSSKIGDKKIPTHSKSVQSLLNDLDSLGVAFIHDSNVDLQNQEIQVSGKIIFSGKGKITNGIIAGNNASIVADYSNCFHQITLKGSWTNDTIPLIWLTAGNNAKRNFEVLINIIQLKKTVFLDRQFPIETRSTRTSYTGDEDIHIVGKDHLLSGLILMTAHARSYAYFRSPSGNNIHLERISILSYPEYKEQKVDHTEYRFVQCYYSSIFLEAKPKIEYIHVRECRFGGNVQLNYRSSPANTSSLEEFFSLKVKRVVFDSCQFDRVVRIIELGNLIYDTVLITNNRISNIYGPLFSASISSTSLPSSFPSSRIYNERKYMLLKGNKVKNDLAVAGINNVYMSLVVAKGFDFDVIDNSIENILNLNEGSETYPFYCSANGVLRILGNNIVDCGTINNRNRFGMSPLIKLKGSDNIEILNNSFHFTRQAIHRLGLIKNPDDDLTTIDSSKLQVAILDFFRPAIDSTTYITIENNVFNTAVLTDVSFLFNSSFTLRNNMFNIEHFRSADILNYGSQHRRLPFTLFYFRSPVLNGELIAENNIINIESLDSNSFQFILILNDQSHFNRVVYKDNVFNVPANVSLSMPRTNELTSVNSHTGRGTISFNYPNTALKNRIVQNLSIDESIQHFNDPPPEGIVHLKTFGSSKVTVKENHSSLITLLQIGFNDLFHHNDTHQLPLILILNAEMTNRKGAKFASVHKIIFEDHRSMWFLAPGALEIVSTTPFWSRGEPERIESIAPYEGVVPPGVSLNFITHLQTHSAHRVGYIAYEGMKDVASFTITAEISPFKSASSALRESFRKELTK
ncbi:MAG TPA: hypothetical protein PKC30_03595 [Saprospiraceae bacterium]|nr:hypothetical protein [Saprospiraceae bacterium]